MKRRLSQFHRQMQKSYIKFKKAHKMFLHRNLSKIWPGFPGFFISGFRKENFTFKVRKYIHPFTKKVFWNAYCKNGGSMIIKYRSWLLITQFLMASLYAAGILNAWIFLINNYSERNWVHVHDNIVFNVFGMRKQFAINHYCYCEFSSRG